MRCFGENLGGFAWFAACRFVWADFVGAHVCFAAAVVSLATFAIPAAATPAWASAGISLSIFAVAAFSVNMYSLPLDAFGSTRAAFAVSILVASYGAIQFAISPAFGKLMDLHRWSSLTTTAALAPLAACAVLWWTRSVR